MSNLNIFEASFYNNLDRVKELIEDENIDVNFKDHVNKQRMNFII